MTDDREADQCVGDAKQPVASHPLLDPNERRVLGVLIEKSLAQPAYYPMTLNAIVAACNQKQNREPVMQLDEPEVYDALGSLRNRRAAAEILPGGGSRTKRYRHHAAECFGWQKRERAVMAELLLRGPQTVGELRTRCSRMVPFDNLEAVTIVLECLERNYDAPFVRPMPRTPGRSAIRHCHLLYPENEQPSAAASSDESMAPVENIVSAPSGLAADVESLRAEVETLKATVDELNQRFDALGL